MQAFIFDLDGVLTADTLEYHYLSWQRLADEEGISFSRADMEILRGLTRRASLNTFLKGRVLDDATAQAWMDRKQGYYLDHMEQMTPANRLPGVTEFLTEARDCGIRLGVASASANVHRVIEKLDLMAYFEVVCGPDSVANPKPSPDQFIWLAGYLRAHITGSVVFEDSRASIQAARQAGFWTVGLGDGDVSAAHIAVSDLSDLDVTWLCDRFQSSDTAGNSPV